MVFLCHEMDGLRPGQEYRFRIRAVNKAGNGPWSSPSFSTSTLPKEPDVPSPPHVVSSTLTSIEFGWHAPDANGAAIVGYRIHIKHTGKEIDVERSTQSYLLKNLQPGKCYQLRVLAKNEKGWSEYSNWSDMDKSFTKVGVPEKASNPIPIGATWSSLTLEVAIPFHNGSPITSMALEQRWVEPFTKGEWNMVKEYRIPDDIEIVEHVDFDEQQKELYQWAVEEAAKLNALKGYNPFQSNESSKITPEQLLEKKVSIEYIFLCSHSFLLFYLFLYFFIYLLFYLFLYLFIYLLLIIET